MKIMYFWKIVIQGYGSLWSRKVVCLLDLYISWVIFIFIFVSY
jgi:hypothetical protein